MSHAELVIPFIESHRHSERVALMDDSDSITYRELSGAIERRAQNWQQIVTLHRPVVMMLIDNSITSVVDYLTALSLDYVVLLLNPECTLAIREQYAQALMPNAVIGDGTVTLLHNEPLPTDARLSLLLSTSGSTGAGKCVALSQRNLRANCDAILKYLPIVAEDITLATLPLSYSYGLSVLHTHLKAGATICFTRHSVFDKAFWEVIKNRPVTSLAGVPSFYEMLLRLRFTRMTLPALRYFTQAGGKLAEAHVTSLAEYAKQTDKAFFVMYGQTEATARMAYLAPHKVLQKPGAMGQAIAGGEFKLTGENPPDGEGELCYRGDNVMLGYVEKAADLAAFTPPEWLATGDLAVCDADGDYTITGRTKRMIKIAGERVNLDVVEQAFLSILAGQNLTLAACVIGEDDKLIAVYSGELSGEQNAQLTDQLVKTLAIPKRNIRLLANVTIALLDNGKIDYATLAKQQIGAV